MQRSLEFKTIDIELAAALMVATDAKPRRILPGVKLVEFVFDEDDVVRDTIFRYSSGTLLQEVRRLANCRSWLYRQTREVSTGREVRR